MKHSVKRSTNPKNVDPGLQYVPILHAPTWKSTIVNNSKIPFFFYSKYFTENNNMEFYILKISMRLDNFNEKLKKLDLHRLCSGLDLSTHFTTGHQHGEWR